MRRESLRFFPSDGHNPEVIRARNRLRGSEKACLLSNNDASTHLPSDQADAILETASALVALDRRDLDAAWHRAHTALERLPR
jgi:hypothetical protein